MKFTLIAVLAVAEARRHHHPHFIQNVALEGVPPSVGLGHETIPATREDFDNSSGVWKGDWAAYRAKHPHDQDCSISESDNWKGAQQSPNLGNAEVLDSVKEEE